MTLSAKPILRSKTQLSHRHTAAVLSEGNHWKRTVITFPSTFESVHLDHFVNKESLSRSAGYKNIQGNKFLLFQASQTERFSLCCLQGHGNRETTTFQPLQEFKTQKACSGLYPQILWPLWYLLQTFNWETSAR